MVGLGKPIRVCPGHVAVLSCSRHCLGVELGERGELESATHTGCAVCRMPPRRTRPTFRILRKCSHCYGRFTVSEYDETHLDEWIAAAKRRVRRITHPWLRAYES